MTEMVVGSLVRFAAEGDLVVLNELIPRTENVQSDIEVNVALVNRYESELACAGTNLATRASPCSA